MSDAALRSALWWVCLLLAPLGLIAVELFHPAGFTAHPGMYQFLSSPKRISRNSRRWDFGPVVVHAAHDPDAAGGSVVIGLWLILADVRMPTASTPGPRHGSPRAAILVFAIYYTVLDAIGGIGLGRTIITAEAMAASGQLDQQQLDGVILLLNAMWTDPLVGGSAESSALPDRGRSDRDARRRACAAADAPRAVAAADLAGRVRLELQNQPRRHAWADRFRPAYRRVGLAVVGQAPARTTGAGIPSIITLMHAGLPLASDRSIAPAVRPEPAPVRRARRAPRRPGRSASAAARSRSVRLGP